LSHGDFARWIHGVLQDEALASTVRGVEERWDLGRPIDGPRREIIEAIENRYLA
jgi:hypothetical protein